mgnify:CR=1 FL=1
MENYDENERMNIIIAGHVDHGKSSIIGRLLIDTNSLSEGKLEQVKNYCKRNARPFEYAFLLDALKDEQSQGITIESARCFFKTQKRQYMIIDAPGHKEFLKNMITGASRAEIGVLVIDASEGIKENSKRHGYLLSLIGIKNIIILVNKMDIVKFDKKVFELIKNEYNDFLNKINIFNSLFMPVCAKEGDNIAFNSMNMNWYDGITFLEAIDSFEKEKSDDDKPFRFPVQDIYKFAVKDNNKRIIAGTVETGMVKVGEEIIILPSNKKAKVETIESFNQPEQFILKAGMSKGFTIDVQLYINRGAIICKTNEKLPYVSHTFKVNLFWMGKNSMIYDKKYKIKINTAREVVFLEKILNIIDASDLTTESNKRQIDRFDVAQCILKTIKPIAFDTNTENEKTSRFVIIDEYDIAGCGIIIEPILNEKSIYDKHVEEREIVFSKSEISSKMRAERFGQMPKFIVITGEDSEIIDKIGKNLEERLFDRQKNVYYLGLPKIIRGLESDFFINFEREEYIRRMGELARIITDIGVIFITGIPFLDNYEAEQLKILNKPNEILIIDLSDNLDEKQEIIKINCEKEIERTLEIIETILLKQNIVEYYI